MYWLDTLRSRCSVGSIDEVSDEGRSVSMKWDGFRVGSDGFRALIGVAGGMDSIDLVRGFSGSDRGVVG